MIGFYFQTQLAGTESAESYGADRMLSPTDVRLAPSPMAADLYRTSTAAATLLLAENVRVTPKDGAPIVMTNTPDLCVNTGLVHPGEVALANNTCSAILITRRRLITAAHCLRDILWTGANQRPDPTRLVALLGHNKPLRSLSSTQNNQFASFDGQIGHIEGAIYCKLNKNTDVAVLQLTEPSGAAYSPAILRKTPPSVGDAAHLISTPKGLPILISTCVGIFGSCVQSIVTSVGSSLFRAPLDSHKGSSGGGIVDDHGNLMGVFSGGLLHEYGLGCDENIVYADTCSGDVVSRVDQLPATVFDDSAALPTTACVFEGQPDYPGQCP